MLQGELRDSRKIAQTLEKAFKRWWRGVTGFEAQVCLFSLWKVRMTALALTEGSVFVGRYRILRPIAAGGMGAVYEVLHIETERRVALKVMLPHLVSNDELRDRFRQEARTAAKIQSAYIVSVFDAGVDDETGMPFLVMELLHGEEIGKRLSRVGRFGFDEVITYLWQTALALDKTHRANIVHRDLKPENLFWAEQDDGPPRIKVLDFGVAKFVVEQGTEGNATGSIGTPLYMAPEQFVPGGKIRPPTDIFSLGMMAFTLLVGVPYWRHEQRSEQNVYAFVAVVSSGPRQRATVRAHRYGVSLPPTFDGWFSRATDVDPKARFGSATEAIGALAKALGVEVPKQIGLSELKAASSKPETDRPERHDEPMQTPLGSGTATSGLSSSHPKVEGASTGDQVATKSYRRNGGKQGLLLSVVGVVALLLMGFVAVMIGMTNQRALGLAASGAPSSDPLVTSAPVAAPSGPLVLPTASAAMLSPVASSSVEMGSEVRAQPPTRPKRALVPPPSPQQDNSGDPSWGN